VQALAYVQIETDQGIIAIDDQPPRFELPDNAETQAYEIGRVHVDEVLAVPCAALEESESDPAAALALGSVASDAKIEDLSSSIELKAQDPSINSFAFVL
jgi:hypothetical protein